MNAVCFVSSPVVLTVTIILSCCSFELETSAETLAAGVEPGSDSAIRKTIERSIPFIEDKGAQWIRTHNCITCHHVPLMLRSLNAAIRHGFDVDDEKLKAADEWATDLLNLTKREARVSDKEKPLLVNENDTLAALILSRPRTINPGDDSWVGKFRSHLLELQTDQGQWNPTARFGSQKRPLRETREVSTMWALLAAEASGEFGLELDFVSEGAAWLESDSQGQSTEWWALRLLLSRALKNDADSEKARRRLFEIQRDDGGWGWLYEEKSDAFGTGIALYALVTDGMHPADPAISHAIQFLVQTQEEDGSWLVNGTFEADREKTTDVAAYWGTCWAVIGLVQAISADRN